MITDDIARLITLTDDELLVELGQAIEAGEGMGAFPSRARVLRKGREWFAAFLNEATGVICTNPQVYAITRRQVVVAEAIEVVALALTDAALALPVPIATVSALFVRRGIENLCATTWNRAAETHH